MKPPKKVTGKERTNFYYTLAYRFLEDIEITENIDINLSIRNSSRKRKRESCVCFAPDLECKLLNFW